MTLYAHVSGSTVDTVSSLPRLYFDGTVWHDWRGPGPWRTDPAAAGWHPIATTPRPADDDTTTHDESVALVSGLPVQTWTPRPWTGLKPLLIDMLNYIIGLGDITSGLETWRGDRVDPALVWLARHQTDTTT